MSGKIRGEDITQIREAVDLVEVVSAYVNLKKTGRIFKGLCPFHKEKTPSFVVDPQKQLFHCFGCGEGGDVYTFLMKSENLDFVEAVENLAAKIGRRVEYDSPQDKAVASKREKRLKVNAIAQKYFNYILTETAAGNKGINYLEERGINKESILSFSLGFAPASGRALYDFLLKKGFTGEELVKGGLLADSERGPLDLFRNRIIFPIFDLKGDTIAFGGRIIGDALPKYINTPETDLFHKGSTLYNLRSAKNEIVKLGKVLVVEGYTDVIMLAQAGVANVVATLGTALTSEHLNLLSRFTEKVVLVFDSDKAGKAAAERGLDFLGQSKVELFVATLSGDMDPADFVVKAGAAEFNRRIEKASPLAEYCIKRSLSKHDLKDASGRSKAIKESLSIISKIENGLQREEYLVRLSDKFDLSYESLLSEMKKIKTRSVGGPPLTINPLVQASERCEREILKAILQYPETAPPLLGQLKEDFFQNELNCKAFLAIKDGQAGQLSALQLIDSIYDQSLKKHMSALSVEEIRADFDDLQNHFKDILIWLKDFYLERQINRLKQELKRVDANASREKADLLFKDLVELEKERRDLRK